MKQFVSWLAAVGVLVVIFGTIYVVAQQSLRSGANYPQIQLAEDTAAALNQGSKPTSLIKDNVDLQSSLAPFIIIYDKTGKVVAGSGHLDGKIPSVPLGVLMAANSTKPYHAVTWQPRSGVRIASVSVAARSYYVLSGRSLTEVEKSESLAFQLSFIGGLVALLVVAGAFTIDQRIKA